MRDKERLNVFYDTLKEIHKFYFPDWRFGQFIINFQRWYEIIYRNDIFYLEENELLDKIKEFKDWTGVKYTNA